MRHDDGESAGHRHARLQGLILEELRALLRDDVSDPSLAPVRLAALVLSVDYRHARVHFTVHLSFADEPTARRDATRGLERATAFLRARLAEAIDMKRVPDLRFVYDGAVSDEGGAHIDGANGRG